jgi:putative ABC transport system permease protein
MNALLRWMILRRLAQERWRTLLVLGGVALGVAVFVSIRLASHSALASFGDSVDAVAGRANLEIASTSDGFDEARYAQWRAMPGVIAAAPAAEVSVLAKPGPPRAGDLAQLRVGNRGAYSENLLVLGLDPFAEGPFHRWDTRAGGAGAARRAGDASGAPTAGAASPVRAAFLRLMAEPGTIAITRRLATRHRLAEGDTVTVLSAGVPVPLRIALVIDAEDLQQAMGGNLVIADIATVQETFHRSGRLDRVDLIVDPARREQVRHDLERLLPRDVTVGLPQGRTRQVENMVSAFQLNLTALSFIALFVSMFLIFNAVAMSVLRWRREIGILRAIGVTRGEVVRLFLAEGAIIGVAGSAGGLALGTLLAGASLHAVGRTLADLYMLQYTSQLHPDWPTYVVGFSLGVACALLSALGPALEAAQTPPGTTIRQGMFIEAQRLPIGRWTLAGFATLALAAIAAWWTVHTRHAWGGFASAFFTLAGFSLLAPGFTLLAERVLRAPAALIGVEGRLASRYLRDSVARASVVVAALMVAVGMMIALNVMVGSFRGTVDTWITQSLRGDLYVEPVGHRASMGATALPPALIESARRLPGIAGIDTYRATRIQYRGALAMAVGIEFAVQRRFGSLQFVGGARAADVLGRALAHGGVIVTESFAHRYRVRAGDVIEIGTPSGLARLAVDGVFYDYSTDAGAVLMDRALFARLWRDPRTESLALYLARGANADSARAAFLALAGPGRLLYVTPRAELRRRVLTVFDQTFQITFALQAIAVLVAMLGVVSTLTALILQRGREIGVLRAIGAMRSQIRSIVLIESAMLGLVGSLLGCVAGLVLALLLVHVINRQFFGWTIRFSAEPYVFFEGVVLVVITALVAGLGPVRLASGRAAAEAMRVD